MNVLVLDIDQAHNKKLIEIPLGEKGKRTFVSQLEEALELLNANPAMESKKSQMEKAIADGTALLDRTNETIERTKQILTEKKNQMDALEDAEKKKLAVADINSVESQQVQSEELKRKLEPAIAAKRNELDALLKTLTPAEEKKIDLFLVDRAFLGNTPALWIEALKKQITFQGNAEVPVVVMGYNENIDYIRQSLAGGYSDYIIKPADALLFKYKASKISGAKSEDEKIFELQTKTEIKILKSAMITKMSEFEVDVQTDAPFNEKEFVEFQADKFTGDKGGGRILGKCLKSEPDASQKGIYSSTFSFVGLNAHSMVELRKWIRMQYVAQKKEE